MSQKINKYIFLIVFNIFNLILFYFAINNLNDKIIYLLFSLISIVSINYFLITWQYYTELFLNVFIYLGFWLKFSYNLYYGINKKIAETNPILSKMAINDNYSEVLFVSSISILFISIVFFLIKKFFPIKNKKNLSFIFLFFIIKKYKNKFLISFFIFFFFIIFFNSYFDFEYLGQHTSGFFIVEKLFKTLLIIILPLFITLVSDLYFKIYGKKLMIILLLILSFFFIAVTLGSRAIIINLIPILLVYFHHIKNLKYIILLTIVSSLFLLISIIIVGSERSNQKISINSFNTAIKSISYLSFQRWVGISGMINVNYTKNKNYKMFIDSLSEKSGLFNFYEKNYFYSQDENSLNFKSKDEFLKNLKKNELINVYVPGFMAYFYYSGSITLLMILNLILIIFLIVVEKSCIFLMSPNNLFIAMFSMILVWRVVHMGLFPLNTLLFFVVLILVPPVFLIIDKFFLKMIKRINYKI